MLLYDRRCSTPLMDEYTSLELADWWDLSIFEQRSFIHLSYRLATFSLSLDLSVEKIVFGPISGIIQFLLFYPPTFLTELDYFLTYARICL